MFHNLKDIYFGLQLKRLKMTESSEEILGPLNLSTDKSVQITELLFPSTKLVQCLFCDKTFKFSSEKHEYLAHLYLNHRLIVGDEDDVAIFHDYLIYWREKFGGNIEKITEFCTIMVMDQMPDGTPSKNEKYYLLCDVTPEDNELRQKLRKKRLELVLSQHQYERTDDQFHRSCLFCREATQPTRFEFIMHLYGKHFLQLGKPENLVFIDELIDTVERKLDQLDCIFCEKRFKDRSTLKEHMRKKGHKRINPDNKSYDRFFLMNYQYQQGSENRKFTKKAHKRNELEPNATEDTRSDSDSNWSDWEGDEPVVTCLFCTHKNNDFANLLQHMKTEHTIDFRKETENMSFYDRVKIVNFVRRKVYMLHCIKCDEAFTQAVEFQNHLKTKNHCSLGNRESWSLPQYFFPTYEDDAFLCNLEADLEAVDDSSIVILSEDPPISVNLHAEALSKEQK